MRLKHPFVPVLVMVMANSDGVWWWPLDDDDIIVLVPVGAGRHLGCMWGAFVCPVLMLLMVCGGGWHWPSSSSFSFPTRA
jgi:hypothetical protein